MWLPRGDVMATLPVIEAVMLMLAVGNAVALVLAWRRYRQAVRLYHLLGKLCIDAFVQQHLPIWRIWSQATGLRFIVSLDKSDGKITPGGEVM